MAGLVGLAVFGTGVVAVFTTNNGTGAAALLLIGAVFVVFAVLGDRIQSVEVSGVTLTLRDLARQTYALADQADARGENEAAERLRTAAKELQDLAASYRRIRSSMRAGGQRTQALERVVTEARQLSSEPFDPVDVAIWFRQGTPEARVTALALMQGNPRLRDFDAALDAIEAPQSAFEQYHGLRLAEMMVNDLTPVQRATLQAVVAKAVGSLRLRASTSATRDTGREDLANRILQLLAASPAS